MDDPHYLALLADAHLRGGEIDAGLAAVAEALELARRERSLFYEPELHRLDGALHAVRATPAPARAPLRRGLARAREQGSATLELRLATDLARLLPDPAARGRGARGASRARSPPSRRASARATCARRPRCSEPAAQAMTPAPASTSTSEPSTTR